MPTTSGEPLYNQHHGHGGHHCGQVGKTTYTPGPTPALQGAPKSVLLSRAERYRIQRWCEQLGSAMTTLEKGLLDKVTL
jgi:hypothetical protein